MVFECAEMRLVSTLAYTIRGVYARSVTLDAFLDESLISFSADQEIKPISKKSKYRAIFRFRLSCITYLVNALKNSKSI